MHSGEVRPLGVFGPLGERPFTLDPAVLRPLVGGLAADTRQQVADYLRGGTIIGALMGHSVDVLDGRFSVAGGFALLTDGEWYWRQDAADYVEQYGIAPPDEFVWQCLRLGTPPELGTDRTNDIDNYLYGLLGKK